MLHAVLHGTGALVYSNHLREAAAPTCLALILDGLIAAYPSSWGTGVIDSSSTFCPHQGRVIRDLLRQLHAVWHSIALGYSNHPREAAASSYLIFGRIASGVPWFLRSTAVLMQFSHQSCRWCRLW